jgi:hypothetical protein
MQYLYATERPDYSDLASGRVFYSLTGSPAFPVRLASEIFQRCLAFRQQAGAGLPCVLYDPCCGAGYLLGVVAYLHSETLRAAIGSDWDEKAVAVARRNLSLLSGDGLARRTAELAELYQLYARHSHKEALASARVFQRRLEERTEGQQISLRTFQASALDGPALAQNLNGSLVDIVLTDVPYGLHSKWQGLDGDQEAAHALDGMLDALLPILAPRAVVALVSDKQQKAAHPKFQRVGHFQVGKRKIVFFMAVPE